MHQIEKDFSFLGHTYRIGTMTCLEQFHVSRHLTPVVATMGMGMFRILSGKGDTDKLSTTDWLLLAAPMADIVSKMTIEESEYIIKTCMAVVKRKETIPGTADVMWAPVMVGAQMMFMDIKVTQMLRLVLEVVRHNLGDFFPMGDAEETSNG